VGLISGDGKRKSTEERSRKNSRIAWGGKKLALGSFRAGRDRHGPGRESVKRTTGGSSGGKRTQSARSRWFTIHTMKQHRERKKSRLPKAKETTSEKRREKGEHGEMGDILRKI